MQSFMQWARSAVAEWDLLEWLTAAAAVAAVVGLVAGALYWIASRIVGYVRRRRAAQQKEREKVRGLLTFLWSHRVLDSPLYQEDPRGSRESVREMRFRLRGDLETLPTESKALPPIREMHEACLSFLDRIEPLPMPREAEPLSDEWHGGVYWEALQDALIRLRRVFHFNMDRLYEGYDIEKPPPRWRTIYVEPLFEPVGIPRPKLPGTPKNDAKVGVQLLRAFCELAEGEPTNIVLRKDAAIKSWLTTDQFDAVVDLLIEEGYIERAQCARSEAFKMTPEGIRKVKRYQLLGQGLNPDTGEPLQG